MRLMALCFALAACLEPKAPGARWTAQLAAACAYQVRCGHIGASEEAACANGADTRGLSFLDGRQLWPETAGYSVSEALADGRLREDPASEAACLEALAEGACSGTALLACLGAFAPTVPAGGACRDHRECVTGICAVATGDFGPISGDRGCQGTCAAELATGAACVGVGLRCAVGDVCDATREVCVPRAAQGEPCRAGTFGSDCADGLVCGPAGVCEARYREGEGCTLSLFPDGGCGAGLVCVAGASAPRGRRVSRARSPRPAGSAGSA